MTPTEWRQLEEVFDRASELDSVARSQFLEEACAGNSVLRRRVESLILSADATGGFMEREIANAAADAVNGHLPAGFRLGAWEIERHVGEGGMGQVYAAARADDEFRKQVAIKVMRAGLGQSQFVSRFRAERQILANLDHPNIARLLDGASGPDGSPYVVMEFIDGMPIDRYCQDHGLGIRERIGLFIQICAAVQYAHQNLVVHRDLKPANLLVTNEAVPKLVDFGIAKLLDPVAQQSSETRVGDRLLTPEYASPEQVSGGPVTTAADVYSLGVVLYELLAEVRPYGITALTPLEIEREVLQAGVRRPSEVGPQRWRREIAGDLDNIVLKAMCREPERRYSSAAALGEDLQRYLDGFPVSARPDSWTYRVQRFVKRNRMGVAAAVLFLLTVAGFVVAMAILTARAQNEAETAREISRFLADVFNVSDPAEARGRTITARELLDRGASRIRSELTARPAVQAPLLTIMGNVYRQMGIYEPAGELLRQALEVRERVSGPEDAETAAALTDLARWYSGNAEWSKAEPLVRRALTIVRKRPSDVVPIAETANDLGMILYNQRRFAEAETYLNEALAMKRRHLRATDEAILTGINNLAMTLYSKGDYAKAEPLMRENVAIRTRRLGEDHPSTATSIHNLAYALRSLGRYAESEELAHRAVAIRTRVLGADHPITTTSLTHLARVEMDLGRAADAVAHAEMAVSANRRRLPVSDSNRAKGEYLLAELLAESGDAERARAIAKGAEQALRVSGARHWHASSLEALAVAECAAGNCERAESLMNEAAAIRRAGLADNPSIEAAAKFNWATIRSFRGDASDAEPLYREALSLRRKVFGWPHPVTAEAMFGLGALLCSERRESEGRPMLEEALVAQERALPVDHVAIARSRARLAACLPPGSPRAAALMKTAVPVLRAKSGNWRVKRDLEVLRGMAQ